MYNVSQNFLTAVKQPGGRQFKASVTINGQSFTDDNVVEIDINDINYCPFPYVEIESTKEEELIEVVGLLGYTMADTTSKTMHEILNDKRIPEGL